MKAFYREYLQIPKHGKIRDKVMTARVVLTAAIIAACLIAMSLTAFAYYSYSVSSGNNILVGANFDARVLMKTSSGQEVPLSVGVGVTPKELTASLGAGEYTLELTHGGTASTGFCVITVTVGTRKTVYHTHQLWQVEEDGRPRSMKATFTLPEAATVSVYSHWGTSSHYAFYALGEESPYYLKDGDEVSIPPYTPPVLAVKPPEQTTGEETTAPPETEEEEELPSVYTVQSGDTLWDIGKMYGISDQRLMAYNGLISEDIYAGQKLAIPPEDWQMPPKTEVTTESVEETTESVEETTESVEETTESVEETTESVEETTESVEETTESIEETTESVEETTESIEETTESVEETTESVEETTESIEETTENIEETTESTEATTDETSA